MVTPQIILEVSLSSLNGFMNIALGVFLLIYGYWYVDESRRDRSIFWFAFVSFMAGAWALSVSTVDPSQLLFFEPLLAYLSSGIIPILLLAFARAFVRKDTRYPRVWNGLYITAFLILAYISIPDIGMISYPTGAIPSIQLGSVAHSVFSAYLLLYFGIAFGILVEEAIRTAKRREEIIVVIAGVLFAVGWAALFNLVIPLLYGDDSFTRVGPFGLLIMNFSVAYLVLKRKFLSLDSLMFRMFLLVLTVLTVFFLELSLLRLNVRQSFDIERGILLGCLVVIIWILTRTVLASSRLSLELSRTNNSLQQEVDDKMMFLQISSHQLRTPVTAIAGYLERSRDYSTSANVGKVLPKIHALVVSLEDIVSDLLSVNSINSGSFRLGTFRQAKLDDLVEKILAEKEFMIENLGVSVSTTYQGKSFDVMVDRVKLQQSLVNIIENAFEYGKGKVDISLIAHRSTVELRIKDYGIGISSNKKAWIFEKYTRGEQALSIRPDGSGIGLYLAKMIIEGHGGEIGVESEGRGKGSEFWIILPKYHG